MFDTEKVQAVVDAYGGVYPVHPDANADHRKCLAAALCKVIELVFKDIPEEFTESEWHMGYWSAHLRYRNEILNLAKSLEETQ